MSFVKFFFRLGFLTLYHRNFRQPSSDDSVQRPSGDSGTEFNAAAGWRIYLSGFPPTFHSKKCEMSKTCLRSLSPCNSRARTLNHETLNQSLLKVPTKSPSRRRRRHGTEPTQIGGILKDNGVGHVSRPFVGVLAGVLYNGMRPLDLAAASTDSSSSSAAAKRRGRGTSTAIGDVR